MQWLPCSASIHDESVTTARFGHTAVCICGSGSVWGTDLVVIFGGVSYNDGDSALEHHAALGDVTVLQAEADMWFSPQVSPAAEVGLPDPRAFHCAASIDRRMYVFGGHVMSYDAALNKKRRRFFNDLWCLDTDTWTWQCLSPSTAGGGQSSAAEVPPRRDMATLTRAGASCLLLFGGRLESGRVAGDAWLLDVTTHTWSLLRMPGPNPPPRKMHAAVYVNNRVVLFGGERDAGLLDDLWTLKGVDGSEAAKWTQIKLRPAPSGRFGHAIAACGSRLAVFGGCLDQSSLLSFSRNYVQCAELWVLDMATFSWHRVEGPEGATTISGSALEDPALLALLHQQAAQRGEQEMYGPGPPPSPQAPALPPVLPLPQERMCHSLVGPETLGRLLLVGGRKRDGICEDAWWLDVGPDDLTPVLTAPRPEDLAAALIRAATSIRRKAPHPQSQPVQPRPPVTAKTAAATTTVAAASAVSPAQSPPVPSSSSQQPPPPPVAGVSVPRLANNTILSNLLRKSAPPVAVATTTPSPPIAGAGPYQQQQQQQQQHLQSLDARPAAVGSTATDTDTDNRSSVSLLDVAVSASSRDQGQPLGGTNPGGGGGDSSLPYRLEKSKSVGYMAVGSPGSAALGVNVVAGELEVKPTGCSFTSGQPAPSPSSISTALSSPVGGRERMSGKASQAFARLTKQVTTLLRNEQAGAQMAAVAGAVGSSDGWGRGESEVPLLSTEGRDLAVGGAPPLPPPPGHLHGASSAWALSPMDSRPSSVTPGGGPESRTKAGSAVEPSEPLPTEVRGLLERLRSHLGLFPSGSPHLAPSHNHSSEPVNPVPALSALGRRLMAEGGVATRTVVTGENAAVEAARRHLVECPLECLTVAQLGLVLADCQALLKSRAAVAWQHMEWDSPQPQQKGHIPSSGGGSLSPGSTPAPLAPQPPNPAALMVLIASHSHWLVGMPPEALRLQDVSRLRAAYWELLRGE